MALALLLLLPIMWTRPMAPHTPPGEEDLLPTWWWWRLIPFLLLTAALAGQVRTLGGMPGHPAYEITRHLELAYHVPAALLAGLLLDRRALAGVATCGLLAIGVGYRALPRRRGIYRRCGHPARKGSAKVDAFLAEYRAGALFEQGVAHMQRGRRKQAANCFRKVWQTARVPAALNNLAAIQFEEGNSKAALRTIQPILDAPEPLPYTHALASLCHAALGQPDAADLQLRLAIADFDEGLRHLRAAGALPDAWVEYTVFIKRVAGTLGKHTLVLRLHQRWPGESLDLGLHYAGVAAFNARWYTQAARFWRQVREADFASVTEFYAFVAECVQRGIVPPFPLEYPLVSPRDVAREVGVHPRARMAAGRLRVLSVAAAFKQVRTEAEATALADALIFGTGDWGRELARIWLAHPAVPDLLKRGVRAVLARRGDLILQPQA